MSPAKEFETKLFAAVCASKYLADQPVWRKTPNRTAVKFSPNWPPDFCFRFCTVYIVFTFFAIFCLFYLLWFRTKKSRIKKNVTYRQLIEVLCVFCNCLPPFLFLLPAKSHCRGSSLMKTQPALILCLTNSNHTGSALIKVLLSTGAGAVKMIKMHSKQ